MINLVIGRHSGRAFGDSLSIHPEYARIFETLRSHDVGYCLLRDELEGGALAGDLDLLVDPDRFAETVDLLQAQGYRVKVSEEQIPLKTVLVRFWEGEFIVVDMHRQLVQNGLVYLDAKGVLARRRPVSEYFLPSAGDFLIILACHDIIGKGRLQDKHYPQVLRLRERVDLETLEACFGERDTAPTLWSVLSRLEQYHADPVLSRQDYRKLAKCLRKNDPGSMSRTVKRSLRRIRRRCSLRTRAPLYALVGVDGAGKSSLIEALLQTFNRRGVFAARCEYMGPWGHYRLGLVRGEAYVPAWSLTTREWIRALRSTENGSRPGFASTMRVIKSMATGGPLDEDATRAHRVIRERSRLFLTLRYIRSVAAATWFFVSLTLEMYYRYLRIYRHRRRGRIVIADRYIYDLMSGRMHQLIPQYRRVRTLLCRLFLRPTRVVLLTNDPATILARKKDLSPEQLEGFMKMYDGLTQQYGFEVIRTDQEPAALAAAFVKRHFDEIVSFARS